jgi:uncharacterized protein (DUF885 family)
MDMARNRNAFLLLCVVLLGILAGCSEDRPSVATPSAPVPVEVSAPAEPVPPWTVEAFMDETYRAIAARSPLNLTYEGTSTLFGVRNDHLDDVSVEYINRTYDLVRGTLEELRSHPRDGLSAKSQLNYDIYEWWLSTKLEGEPFAFHNYDPVTATADRLYDIEEIWPITTADDVEDYLSRLSEFRRYYHQQVEGLAYREEQGIMPPRFMIEDAQGMIAWVLGIDEERPSGASSIAVEASPVFQMIVDRLGSRSWASKEEMDSAIARARELIGSEVIPGLWEMLSALDAAVQRAPEIGGATALPNGEAYMDYCFLRATTLSRPVTDLRRIGQAEVDRVLAETDTVLDELGHPELANYQELMRLEEFQALNYDLTTPEGREAYLSAIRQLVAQSIPVLRGVFDLWPSTEMEIHPDLDGYGNFCTPPAIDGSRPGYMTIGLGAPTADYGRLPLVIYHEGIPGHFLQMSVAQDLDLPLMRRIERCSAYVEGWAMYCERLAWEMGLYGDRSAAYRLAQLEGELVRACRVVLDVGIHDEGWSHIQAGIYLERITGLQLPTYSVMDVYVGIPGQASSYTIGCLEILRLREKARAALGDRFMLAEFHHAVLSQGSVPLPILERLVDDYIQQTMI